MKYILFLIVLAFISCDPFSDQMIDRIKTYRLARHEKIIECVKERGSETLKKLITENKELKLGKLIKGNKDITEEDKEIFQNCRRKALSLIKSFKKKNLLGFRSNERNRRDYRP